MEKKVDSFIRVYCPELMDTIIPGEWTDCPYYRGQKLELSTTEEALKQIFRCHVQCDCKIQYRYYEKGRLVDKFEDSVEDPENLRRILQLVMEQRKKPGGLRTPKIFIVDDDLDFLEIHATVLKNKGYEVASAQNSEECLVKLEKDQPDVVVLDVMMERFDSGFSLSKKIKRTYPHVPVVLLTSIGLQTGLDFSSNADVLEATGADLLLDKPVTPEAFVAAIGRLIADRT